MDMEAFKGKTIEFLFFLVFSIALASMTYRRNAVWLDGLTLWTSVLERSPGKWRPYDKLGVALYRRGEVEKALNLFETALKLKPDNYELHNNIGLAYQTLGMKEKAMGEYMLALEKAPESAMAYLNIGTVYLNAGDFPSAAGWFLKAVEKDPDDVAALVNAGFAYGDMEQYDKAIGLHRRALAINPYDINAHFGLGLAYEGLGRVSDESLIPGMMKDFLREPDPSVQLAYCFALARMGQPEFVDRIALSLGNKKLQEQAHDYAVELGRQSD